MKKIIIILTALTMTLGANAQNFTYGVKAGVNLSQLSYVEYGDGSKQDASDMMFGFHVGGYAHYSFNEMLGLQGELLFSTQGGKKKGFGDAEINLNFINVPVLLSFTVPSLPEFRVFAGAQVGYNISRKISWGNESYSGSKLDDVLKMSGEKINSVDVATVLGAQYTFVDHFTVGLRYNLGLTSASSATDGGDKVSGNYHRVFQLSFGWTF